MRMMLGQLGQYGWPETGKVNPYAVLEAQAISDAEKAKAAGVILIDLYLGRLNELKAAGYQYTQSSLTSALTSAKDLLFRWNTVRQQVRTGAYKAAGDLIAVNFLGDDLSLADAMQRWVELVTAVLGGFNAGLGPEEAAVAVDPLVQALSGGGLSGNSLLLIGAGLVLVILLRK